MTLTKAPTLIALLLLGLTALTQAQANKDNNGQDNNGECRPGDYAPSGVKMTLRPVSEHAWYVMGAPGIATDNQGFISNAGVIITPEGVVIFDALGSPSLSQQLLGLIREKTPLPIKKVIVSHYHADHIYGLQVFQEQGAEIIGPDAANDYLDSDAANNRLEERRFSLDPYVNDCTHLIPPDIALKDSKTFELGGLRFHIQHLGAAHSKGDMALLVEPDRVLYSGDVIFEGRVPFVGDANSGEWLRVLTELETRGIQAVVPGHGPAATQPQKAISGTRRYLAKLRDTMGQAVEELIPFEEAYAAADWSEFKKLPAFSAANRRNAYQVYLSMEAESLNE